MQKVLIFLHHILESKPIEYVTEIKWLTTAEQ